MDGMGFADPDGRRGGRVPMATILVAGEEGQTLNTISIALEWHGYEMIYATDARDAVQTMLSTKNNNCTVDLFILEVGSTV
jgi:CheY-like chemotaxis protein